MKKRLAFPSRQILFGCVILLLFTLMTLFLFSHKRDEKRFSRLTQELFVEEMTANTLNMHYTLASPEAFGIYDYKPILPFYRADTESASRAATEETLTALKQISVWNLSEQDAYTYELLVRLLENSLRLKSFTYYEEPLSPSSGVQSQLPVLLAEYTFRNRRDVEDYLALLDQTDTYLGSLLTYEREKAAAGMPMSTYSYRQVKHQCDTIVTKKSLEEGNHFLQTTFRERINSLLEKNIITSKEAEQYLSQNNRLLCTVLQPAYEALADGMFLLEDAEGAEPLPVGLASRPEGKEYYQCLLTSETGSRRSVEDVRELLGKTLQEEYTALCSLMTEYPDLAESLAAEEYTLLPCQDAKSMLQDIRLRMTEDFPELPVFSDVPNSQKSSAFTEKNIPVENSSPRVTIKSVSRDLEDYCAPAFYLTAPLDDTDNNVIYINNKNTPSGLELYTTLAHEGYPGHLYQTVYNNRNLLSRKENPIRQLLWYGGYLEGWALYVEFYGYDCASELLREQGREQDALCVQAEKHNRSLLLCLYSTLDIMIHYDNASREDVANTLSAFGIKNTASVNAVYNYIADEPCNYLKYYLGYLEILELKEHARTVWGDNYSDMAFHAFLLDSGPSDFTALRDRLH